MSLHNDLQMGTEIGEKRAIDDILANEKMVDLVNKIETADAEKRAARPQKNMNTVWLRKGHRRENRK
jgi:hypothetical protein